MKVNETPEKIYLPNNPVLSISNLNERTSEDDIEYIRTDAFIEKAATWLEDNAINYWGTDAVDNGKMMLDFKKAMRV